MSKLTHSTDDGIAEVDRQAAERAGEKPNCETNGHIFGSRGVCVFCSTPKPMTPPDRPAPNAWRTKCPVANDWCESEACRNNGCGRHHAPQPEPDLDADESLFFKLHFQAKAAHFFNGGRESQTARRAFAMFEKSYKETRQLVSTLRAQLAERDQNWLPKRGRRSAYVAVHRDDLASMKARVAALEAALTEIRDRHIPDQPSALDIDEDVYLKRQYAELRRIASAALKWGADT